jgi:hypothetical protein
VYHYVDTGASGLVIRVGTAPAVQVLGTDNTGVEGNVLMYNSLNVGLNVAVGNTLTVTGVNVMSELANKQSTLTGSSVVSVSRLTATDEVVTDKIRASTANALTCADNLVVDGSLTVGGQNVATALAAREPAFTAVAPLQKVVNFQTGQLELRVISPFWVAGKVGGDANVVVSRGQVGFTCTRIATGNFRVDFASPHPDGADYVVVVTSVTANYWVDHITSSSFLAVVRTSSFAPTNTTFFFSVLA